MAIPPSLDCCDMAIRYPDMRCEHQGKSIAEHCAAGAHCTSTTASCAMELGGDDHPTKCCDCQAEIPT